MSQTDDSPKSLTAVRFKLGIDEPAEQPDALGRNRIGYAPNLSTAELWERGRGVWKAKLTTVAECDLVILAHKGAVVLVGSVGGVTFHGDRIAVTGTPDPTHPLIGQPDPLDNASRNPVTYGEIRTVHPSATQRPYQAVLANAIDVLTEAARLRRPTYTQTASGKWEPDPDRTEQADWAEFVTLALTAAAANIGGVDDILSGRPGSWEAAGIETLLHSSVGADEHGLWEHRTEPILIRVSAQAVRDQFHDGPEPWKIDDEIDSQEDTELEQLEPLDWDAVYWAYTVSDHGDPTPRSADAPDWSWDAYRALLAHDGLTPEKITQIEKTLRELKPPFTAGSELGLPKDAAAQTVIYEREEREDEIRRKYAAARVRAEAERSRADGEFAAALRVALERELAALPGLAVPIDIEIDVAGANDSIPYAWGSFEWNLIERAAAGLQEESPSER